MSSKAWTSPKRTIHRSRRCENCIHFEAGEIARKLWEQKLGEARAAFELKRLELEVSRAGDMQIIAPGITDEQSVKPVAKSLEEAHPLHRAMSKAIAEHHAGICLKGKVQTDFVHCNYLCDGGWNGRDGASLATAGHPLDKSNEELKDMLDPPAPVKPKTDDDDNKGKPS